MTVSKGGGRREREKEEGMVGCLCVPRGKQSQMYRRQRQNERSEGNKIRTF